MSFSIASSDSTNMILVSPLKSVLYKYLASSQPLIRPAQDKTRKITIPTTKIMSTNQNNNADKPEEPIKQDTVLADITPEEKEDDFNIDHIGGGINHFLGAARPIVLTEEMIVERGFEKGVDQGVKGAEETK